LVTGPLSRTGAGEAPHAANPAAAIVPRPARSTCARVMPLLDVTMASSALPVLPAVPVLPTCLQPALAGTSSSWAPHQETCQTRLAPILAGHRGGRNREVTVSSSSALVIRV